MAHPVKKQLSKNLAEMKFMQKGLSTDGTQVGESHDSSSMGALIKKWVVPDVPVVDDVTNKMKSTNSFIQCEELNRLGRFSYNKFNKEIERLSERYARQGGLLNEESSEDEEEATVSVQEMVRRYEDNTSKKSLGKHGRLYEDNFDGSERHRLLKKRISKMDKDGFIRPS
ncbi:M-phase phosphoprotein 6-like [Halichondria panicea]|uniref:M-phase phosphoprotein 6-like n=1 Tax=Halichondria panicea TaxID=6063 RepID=UPI00312B670F